MKIKHINGLEVDTDKLPDMEAMAIEKVEEFRLFCLDNKIPFLLFVDPKGAAKIGDFLSFWNYSNRSIEYKQGDKIDMYPIFVCVDAYIRHVSNNQIAIKNINQE
jgi:hypothetical protein